ncbi:hypothetical protein BDN70DRAFT_930379 [Pholiota conissans]|uniref:Uncharacterized protein n=1 Tax=Pholiota conissans TaxID=109636 RepID=A0A9P5Z5U3_9AGAR|nr:hypothetical protein BDN70DRAFT_930379 [Pholiota conissans]
MSTPPREGLFIPAEICHIICQNPELTHADFKALAAVSRNFRGEAYLLSLYSSAEVRDPTKLRTFCTTAIRQPHLAKVMRNLVLHMPAEGALDPDTISAIVQLLSMATNLQSLHVLSLLPNYIDRSKQSWILCGHSFRLTTLVNTYFNTMTMKEMIYMQPKLQTLMIPHTSRVELWLPHFSHLTTFSCSAFTLRQWYEGPAFTNIERLQFGIMPGVMDKRAMPPPKQIFKLYKAVKSLSVSIQDGLETLWKSWTMEAMVAAAAVHMHGIKFLQIMDYTQTKKEPRVSFFLSIARFKQLETLILRPPNLLSRDQTGQEPILSSWRGLQTDAGRKSTAEEIMGTLPTLKRLIFTLNVDSEDVNYEFKRVSSSALDLLEALVTLHEDEWLL